MKLSLKKYKDLINLRLDDVDQKVIEQVIIKIKKIKKTNKKIIIIGNGGSAAIASHVATDFTKNAGVRTTCFADSSLITCLANDYGHENWMSKSIELYVKKNDLVILISSSGNSKNIVNAAKFCKKNGINFITLTGMSKKNKLFLINKHGLNIWIDSKSYNIIEITHLSILLYLVDRVIGKLVYKSS